MDSAVVADGLRESARHMRGRSPLYERMTAGLAGAVEKGIDGGVIARLHRVEGPANPLEARLLILSALHHAVLTDPSLPLAAWYPTVHGSDARRPEDGAPVALALAYLVEHEEEVAAFVGAHRLQTNEVGRCMALLPGFLIAATLGMPLRLLEVGCAAGLNLRFDRYHYVYRGGPTWGPSSGPHLEATAEGNVPRALVPPTVEIADRRGVDLYPMDAADPEQQQLLRAFVWPDEHDRHRRLTEALAVAPSTPVTLETGDLAAWSREHLQATEGTTTVLFHSAVADKLDEVTRSGFDIAVERALRAATAAAPFVYLPLEAPRGVEGYPELTIATGDGSGPPRRQTLLTADFHGRWVTWW